MTATSASLQTVPAPFGAGGRDLDDLLAIPRMRTVVIAASKDPNAKITVLLIPAGADHPSFAVKAPTTDEAASAIERERRILESLARRLSHSPLLANIPRIVDTVTYQGRAGLVVTALPGTPMTSSYLRWRHTARRGAVEADFAAARRWLADFQTATAGPRAPLDMDGGVAERVAERFGGDACLSFVLDRLSQIFDLLRTSETPRTTVHGDMWCGNLLMSSGGVAGVVDWEAGAPSGEPVRDLVRFAHMYALFLDRHTRGGRPVAGHHGLRAGKWGAGVEYALDGSGWFPEIFRRFLRDGLSRLGASAERWREAALAGVAEVAATADDEDYALSHLRLCARLAGWRG